MQAGGLEMSLKVAIGLAGAAILGNRNLPAGFSNPSNCEQEMLRISKDLLVMHYDNECTSHCVT